MKKTVMCTTDVATYLIFSISLAPSLRFSLFQPHDNNLSSAQAKWGGFARARAITLSKWVHR